MSRQLAAAGALAAVSTCFLAAPAAPAGGVPATLLGKWTRTGPGINGTGLVLMVVKPNDHLALFPAGATVAWQIRFSARADGRMTIGPMGECVAGGFLTAGAYRWKVAGRTLTITKVRDKCAFEVRWFAGSWARK